MTPVPSYEGSWLACVVFVSLPGVRSVAGRWSDGAVVLGRLPGATVGLPLKAATDNLSFLVRRQAVSGRCTSRKGNGWDWRTSQVTHIPNGKPTTRRGRSRGGGGRPIMAVFNRQLQFPLIDIVRVICARVVASWSSLGLAMKISLDGSSSSSRIHLLLN